MSRSVVVSTCAALVVAACLSTVSVAGADEVAPVTVERDTAPVPPAVGLIVRSSAPDATLARASETLVDDEADVAGVRDLTSKVSVVQFDAPLDGERAREVAADLQERSDVAWALPDYLATPAELSPNRPNDPEFGKQHNIWDERTSEPGGYGVRAPYAWSSTKGAGTVVAVLDTGIVASHPDLKGQIVAGYDFVTSRYTANDGSGRDKNPSDPGDWIPKGDKQCYGVKTRKLEKSSWHGTHVAGIVAARQGNKIGVSGIAPAARIQPVRVMGRCGGSVSDIVDGITWASGGTVSRVPANTTRADVINLSLAIETWGWPDGEAERLCSLFSTTVAAAQARGSVVIAAAGNEYDDGAEGVYSAPAICDGVIAVTATADDGLLATYANVGSHVDLAAPGGEPDPERARSRVLSTYNTGSTKPSKSTYRSVSGTSMATPAVSAAAALLRSEGVPAADVAAALRAAVRPFGQDPTLTDFLVGYVQDENGLHELRRNLNCSVGRCGTGILDLGRAPLPVAPPQISGRLFAGETLTATPGTWSSATAPTVLYQWTRDGADIGGATAATYTLTAADRGRTIAVRVRPAAAAFASLAQTSASTAKVGYAIAIVEHPSLVGLGLSGTIRASLVGPDGPAAGKTIRFVGESGTVGEAVTDSDGIASLTLDGSNLTRGLAHRISAVHSETVSRFWSTGQVVVRYDRLTPTVTQVVPTTAKAKKTFTVRVSVAAPGVAATGRVRVSTKISGKITSHAWVALPADGSGVVDVPVKLSKKGTHVVAAVFDGNEQLAYAAVATTAKIKIS